MTESLFRIQHPLTPQLSALCGRCTELFLAVANVITKHNQVWDGLVDGWGVGEDVVAVLFAVAEKSAQESGGFALSGNTFEYPISTLTSTVSHGRELAY